MAKKENEMTFEHALDRLEEIADTLESGDLNLDDTMSLFEEANDLSRFCTTKIEQAEDKLRLLTKKQDGLQVTDESN